MIDDNNNLTPITISSSSEKYLTTAQAYPLLMSHPCSVMLSIALGTYESIPPISLEDDTIQIEGYMEPVHYRNISAIKFIDISGDGEPSIEFIPINWDK